MNLEVPVYPSPPDFERLKHRLEIWSQFKHENGARGIRPLLDRA